MVSKAKGNYMKNYTGCYKIFQLKKKGQKQRKPKKQKLRRKKQRKLKK